MPLPSINQTPALLLMPEYAGTLAAARCLAGHGVAVHLASRSAFAPAVWSRSVAKRLHGPTFLQGPAPILEWLVEQGAKGPKKVLYPTCDELAWLFARHRDLLETHYWMYSPEFAAIRSVLDKRALYGVCQEVGIDVPETLYPETESELEQVARRLSRCIVKPRTQTFFNAHAKGELACGEAELKRIWRYFRTTSPASEIIAEVPDIGVPMVQEFIPVAESGVLSVSGFIDKFGRMLATRGSRKVLQDPPGAGIGVCFEAVEAPVGLVERVASLCRKVGFYGVFEAEFLRVGSRNLLIDFNPRYFGQMGFDIARGMELPWLAHLCAIGDDQAAVSIATEADSTGVSKPVHYQNQVALFWRLATSRIFGAIESEEVRRWREWMKQGQGQSIDAFFALSDPCPAIAFGATQLWSVVRYPRGFWRSIQAAKTR
jgi:predicted ATP-grasp superfamily ATP-dependent carboligase